MERIILYTSLFLTLNVYSQFTSFNLGDIGDLEDYHKTLVILEQIFETKPKDNFLKKISTNKFIKSKEFQKLQQEIDNKFINLAYTNELLKKEFPIENSKSSLVIDFNKHIDLHWYINNAYIIDKNKKIIFKGKGFKPLAVEYNFVDFIEAIENNEITSFSGLAPHGKLPIEFINSKKFKISQSSILFINNVIIHNNNKITSLYTIKLIYKKKLNRNKQGWLIDDFIPSIKYEKRTLLTDYLSGNTSDYELNKKSNYFYNNLKNFNLKSITKNNLKRKIVIKQKVNVRKSPSTSSKIIGIALKNEIYNVSDESFSFNKNKWYKIDFKGFYGWVFGKYVTVSK